MQKQEEINNLAAKWIAGTITEEEKALFNQWYNSFNFEELELTGADFDEALLKEKVRTQLWKDISKLEDKGKTLRLWYRIAGAAVILIMVGIGLWFYAGKNSSRSVYVNDVAAGGNKAYLILSNGQRILLSGAENGVLAKQSGVEVIKTASGQVIYQISSDKTSGAAGYNVIETPMGGQYEVRLPDSTRVWLNAASSLKFPVSFTALKERRVELAGEGYFEVAKDKVHPFIVQSSRQEVKVLGTHFNISNYADESDVKTTLLEGAVMINNQSALKPGEQAILSHGIIHINEVDPEEAIAWKKGYFQFTDEPLESILLKVSRWYDVRIKFEDSSARKIAFSGTMSKYKTISGILNKLEKIGAGHFKVEGKTVTVVK